MKNKLFYGKIIEGKIVCGGEFDLYLGFLEGKDIVIKIGPKKENRTISQNNALHLWFSMVSEEMMEKGIDMKEIIRVPISPTPYMIKENLWKPLQNALFGKKSTTELLKNGEIDIVYDHLNRAISERTHGQVKLPPFPSINNI